MPIILEPEYILQSSADSELSFKNKSIALRIVDLPTSFLPTMQVNRVGEIEIGSLIPFKIRYYNFIKFHNQIYLLIMLLFYIFSDSYIRIMSSIDITSPGRIMLYILTHSLPILVYSPNLSFRHG